MTLVLCAVASAKTLRSSVMPPIFAGAPTCGVNRREFDLMQLQAPVSLSQRAFDVRSHRVRIGISNQAGVAVECLGVAAAQQSMYRLFGHFAGNVPKSDVDRGQAE